MRVGAVLTPLVRGLTYRRGIHLLLGAVLALPYILLGSMFWQLLFDNPDHRVLLGGLLLVAAAVAVVPPFLRGTRAVEISAARWLLQIDLPDPPSAPMSRETRIRAALWFTMHLVVGAAVAAVLLTALPLALTFLVYRLVDSPRDLVGPPLNLFDPDNTVALTAIGLGLLIVVGYAVAGLGALAATMAPVLLGPSAQERIAVLEARAATLAERNRLARELHDSVGHALTVTTLQAAAARQLLDTDVSFVRGALTAIEDTGRAAMADLDHMLGVLRDGERADRNPHRTLAELDRLVAEMRSAGVLVDLDVSAVVAAVPTVVSREGYRIVQESLTNALRHAGPVTVSLRAWVDESSLHIELTNPFSTDPLSTDPMSSNPLSTNPLSTDALRTTVADRPVSGRGLIGMRERVTLLGGELTVGPQPGGWRVGARLPIAGPS